MYLNPVTLLFITLLVLSQKSGCFGKKISEMSKSELSAEVQKGLKMNIELILELASQDVILRDPDMEEKIRKLKAMELKERIGASDEKVLNELADYYIQKTRVAELDEEVMNTPDLPFTTTDGVQWLS